MYKYLLFSIIILSVIHSFASSPKELFKNLSTLDGGYNEYSIAINNIIPNLDTALTGIDEFYQEIMQPKYLRFSESFSVNLDNDPDSEFVSQIVFRNSDRIGAAGADGEILFLIFIQDDSTHNYSLIHFQTFELSQCEYLDIDENAMTFGFHASAELIPNSSYKYVKFSIHEVSSCGLEMDKSDREDHFIYDNQQNRWKYETGAVEDDGEYINRMDYAE